MVPCFLPERNLIVVIRIVNMHKNIGDLQLDRLFNLSLDTKRLTQYCLEPIAKRPILADLCVGLKFSMSGQGAQAYRIQRTSICAIRYLIVF